MMDLNKLSDFQGIIYNMEIINFNFVIPMGEGRMLSDLLIIMFYDSIYIYFAVFNDLSYMIWLYRCNKIVNKNS